MTEEQLNKIGMRRAQWHDVVKMEGENYKVVLGDCMNCAIAFNERLCLESPDCGFPYRYEVTDELETIQLP